MSTTADTQADELTTMYRFLIESEHVGSFRDPDYQEQYHERHCALLRRAYAHVDEPLPEWLREPAKEQTT